MKQHEYTQNEIADMIVDFVIDHRKHFGCYPIEVEAEGNLYSWDEYWQILENDRQAVT